MGILFIIAWEENAKDDDWKDVEEKKLFYIGVEDL